MKDLPGQSPPAFLQQVPGRAEPDPSSAETVTVSQCLIFPSFTVTKCPIRRMATSSKEHISRLPCSQPWPRDQALADAREVLCVPCQPCPQGKAAGGGGQNSERAALTGPRNRTHADREDPLGRACLHQPQRQPWACPPLDLGPASCPGPGRVLHVGAAAYGGQTNQKDSNSGR